MLEQVHACFREWAEGRGVRIDGLRVVKLPGKGIGIVATRKLKVVHPHAVDAAFAEQSDLMLSIERGDPDLRSRIDSDHSGFQICP